MKQTEYAACALGEILIDFTPQGVNKQGQRLFAQNAGGAPGNVAAAMAKLGANTAFIGKAENVIHGRFLGASVSVLPDEKQYGDLWWGEGEFINRTGVYLQKRFAGVVLPFPY